MALNWLKTNFSAAKAKALEEIAKFKNDSFMQGTIAVCAYMAYADGIVDPKEKQKMMQFVQHSDELKVFKADDVIAAWTSISGKFDFDLDFGKLEALKIIGKLRSKPEAARAMVRVGLIIANADGHFDETEKRAAREICKELGLPTEDFDL